MAEDQDRKGESRGMAPVEMSAHGPRVSSSDRQTEHQRLAGFNRQRLRPSLPRSDWRVSLDSELWLHRLEMEFLERERASMSEAAQAVPRDAAAFVGWFERLELTGPGQHDPLFAYLAEEATLDEMRWFLAQEVAGEAGFDDLVAVTQVKLPTSAKLELARNYWDEMGRGRAEGMHGGLLDVLVEELDLDARPERTVWQSLAVANLLTGLAWNRGYAYHSIGALGAVELTAPGRTAKVNEGLRRLGFNARMRRYFALHATLDIKHAEAWNREVLMTLVDDDPELARPIAEGALMRLTAGARCFARYRLEFGIDGVTRETSSPAA